MLLDVYRFIYRLIMKRCKPKFCHALCRSGVHNMAILGTQFWGQFT